MLHVCAPDSHRLGLTESTFREPLPDKSSRKQYYLKWTFTLAYRVYFNVSIMYTKPGDHPSKFTIEKS